MGNSTYNARIATHYAAYRPPLHERILKECLGQASFRAGLDVGCGMGHSSVALSKWCETVTGLEPSVDMLTNALKLPTISYESYSPGPLPFSSSTFDIVTYAGSWYYAHSGVMVDETIRVIGPEGIILCYDFALDLTEIEEYFNWNPGPSGYDHAINFDLYETGQLEKIDQAEQTSGLQIQPEELAHLLLAEEGWHDHLPVTDFSELSDILARASLADILPCTLYYTLYRKR